MKLLVRVFAGAVLLGATLWGQNRILPESMAPFVPTPQPVVEKMLELANVKPADVVYDLGCGDGRVPITAAKKFGARAVGVELSPRLARLSQLNVKEEGLEDRVRIIEGHLMDVDLKGADVVALYLLTDSNEKVKPKLEAELKRGARVISHDFEVMHWVANKIEKVESGRRTHTLYLYTMPPKKLDQ